MAAMYAGGLGLAPAQAGDLGGNCCVDLEERVAELEATTARKGNRRVSLTISGQVATHLMYWNDGGSAAGGPGNAGSSSSDLYIVDNTHALGGSQFQFAGSAKINPNVSSGFQIVVGLDAGARSAGAAPVATPKDAGTGFKGVTQVDDDGSAPADSAIVLTLANWYIDHKELGRITVGRANTASAGVSTIDLGGTGVIAGANLGYWAGNFSLILNNTLQVATWGDLIGHGSIRNSGLSRANVISYTSPTFAGFSFAAAWGENDLWDAALRYAGEFAGFRVAAGIGYISNTTGFGDQVADIPANNGVAVPSLWKGSASVLHVATGLFVSGSYVERDNDVAPNLGYYSGAGNSTLWHVQGGVAKNWTGLGNTVLYGEYARADDGVFGCLTGAVGSAGESKTCTANTHFGGSGGDQITSSEVTVWGLGVVQNIDAAAMELYLAYRHYQGSVTSPAGNTLEGTEHFNDLDLVVGGARIKF